MFTSSAGVQLCNDTTFRSYGLQATGGALSVRVALLTPSGVGALTSMTRKKAACYENMFDSLRQLVEDNVQLSWNAGDGDSQR